MAQIEKEPLPTLPLGGIKAQSEEIAFRPESMLKCDGCGRMNPPNRTTCLYCSHALDLTSAGLAAAGLKIRKPEEWEPAFNIIALSGLGGDHTKIANVARITDADAGSVSKIAACTLPMPLVRVSSEVEADLICKALEQLGVRALSVGDDRLMPNTPPVRLRFLEFLEDSLAVTEFNTRRRFAIARDQVAAIVLGTISKTEIDQLEKKRRGSSKLLEAYETSTDSMVIDIYTRGDPAGYRVMLSGFDFSGLGDEKRMFASENMAALAAKLRAFAPEARFVESYAKIHHELDEVWPVETRSDPKGLQRSGFAKFEFGNRVSSNNLRQLNRYSRLQWFLV